MEVRGFTYGYMAKRGAYQSEAGKKSQEAMFDIGINWMCLAFPLYQDTYQSTKIRFDYRYDITEKDILTAIKRAKDRNIKVCLKPMVNCKDHIWRAYIDFPEEDFLGEDTYWKQWFESYTAFLIHYAEIAQDTGCELFCIGCEMLGTERKEEYWREVIKRVREVYKGPITYNTNHGKEDKVTWFDALDYIGTSAYYPVARAGGAIKDSMVKEWIKIRDDLKVLSEKLNKKILFMEIGCRSAKGCASMPWDFMHKELEREEEEQAAFYESCLEVFFEEPWFQGIFWWDWSTVIYDTEEEAKNDVGFNIHRKKAETVIKKWYQKGKESEETNR